MNGGGTPYLDPDSPGSKSSFGVFGGRGGGGGADWLEIDVACGRPGVGLGFELSSLPASAKGGGAANFGGGGPLGGDGSRGGGVGSFGTGSAFTLRLGGGAGGALR